MERIVCSFCGGSHSVDVCPGVPCPECGVPRRSHVDAFGDPADCGSVAHEEVVEYEPPPAEMVEKEERARERRIVSETKADERRRKTAEAVKRSREKDPQAYKDYMRQYMAEYRAGLRRRK